MDDFKIMYKILKILDESMDLDEFDPTGISPEALGCTVQRRDRLLIKMQEAGYISGLQIKRFMRQEAFIASPIMPEITINGIQFLHENSMMRKAANIAKGIIETIKVDR